MCFTKLRSDLCLQHRQNTYSKAFRNNSQSVACSVHQFYSVLGLLRLKYHSTEQSLSRPKTSTNHLKNLLFQTTSHCLHDSSQKFINIHNLRIHAQSPFIRKIKSSPSEKKTSAAIPLRQSVLLFHFSCKKQRFAAERPRPVIQISLPGCGSGATRPPAPKRPLDL